MVDYFYSCGFATTFYFLTEKQKNEDILCKNE